ncbi:MAG: phosphatidylserine decarboxylase [Candidatus Parcubacteria bacterium]|nr:phosphatidylserine decarboxylase [Burkholderiales bacterium]
MPARTQADRRPDVRGRHRHHELLDLEQRRVRGVRERTEDHRRGHAPAHEGDPRPHPVGRVRQGIRAREPRRAAHAAVAPPADRRAPDREGRRAPARNDALDQEEPARRYLEELVNYPHPIIAREGWPYLGLAVAVSLAVNIFCGLWWALPLWVVSVFILQFFRDPPRTAPSDPQAVLSPADGRVVVVGKVRDPYLDREALKISVFMNVFNVHSNRSPVDGTVKQRWYHAGSFLNAAMDKASLENERNALWLQTPAGQDITCVQIAGLVARRILCYVDQGAVLHRGQRYGFIRFGSRVDLYLPPDAQPRAALGDTVYATESVLAWLPPTTSPTQK